MKVTTKDQEDISGNSTDVKQNKLLKILQINVFYLSNITINDVMVLIKTF